MRRHAVAALAILCTLFAVVALLMDAKLRASERSAAEAASRETALHERYDTALRSLAEIQDSLNVLAMGEEALALEPGSAGVERELAHAADPVLQRIDALRGSVDRTRDRIGTLDAHLQQGGLRLRSLETGLSRMRLATVSKDERIVVLRRQVDSLQSTVTGLLADAEELRRELGTVLVAAGTRKELTEAGVVVAEGGILGIGRTLKPSGNVDESKFVPVDTDIRNVLVFRTDHLEVLSAQPVSSYRIETVGDQVRLHIVDPHEFRKVKHLVVLTT